MIIKLVHEPVEWKMYSCINYQGGLGFSGTVWRSGHGYQSFGFFIPHKLLCDDDNILLLYAEKVSIKSM